MKIYWLFGGDCYYAGGGMNDYIGRFETIEEATAAANAKAEEMDIEWWHVLNLNLGIIVAHSVDVPHGQWNSTLPNGLGP